MEKIKEKIFKLSDDNSLIDLICLYHGIEAERLLNYKFCHIVYLDTDPKELICTKLTNIKPSKTAKQPFVEELKMLDISNFNQLLLLVTKFTSPDYKHYKRNAGDFVINKNPHLDEFLKETNGWLVYSHQLENLYMMAYDCGRDKAIEFRKESNMRFLGRTNENNEAKNFGTTIGNIISERTREKFVANPQYNHTYKLYKHLNNIDS